MKKHIPAPFLTRGLAFAVLALTLASCHDTPDYDRSRADTFEALWRTIDQRYCFFREKSIDWDSVRKVYEPRAMGARSTQIFFNACADMLDELRDGHVNLSSGFATSYYKKWWSDYPENYNERIIQQYYLRFQYRMIGSITYGFLDDNIGYIRYPSFSTGLGEGNIDYILQYFSICQGLIIDVRSNGGGDLTNVEKWVSRFITERTLAGYISHKTGPGHDDFSEPFAFYYTPPGNGHLLWTKPVVVLANRGTFSAANNFVSIMKLLPGVKIVGATTGGGSGMPFSAELPNGWGLRFSACSILDAEGKSTEFGVEPSEGCAVDMSPEATLDGHDTILDHARNVISSWKF